MVEEVIYTGDIEDVKTAYAALDISVQTSVLPEAFGLVVAESMAMGKPVIASRSGGTVEQIDDGVSGILVDPGDVDQLVAALERLQEDPDLRVILGANAKKKFLETFEFEIFYGKLLRLQASLMAS